MDDLVGNGTLLVPREMAEDGRAGQVERQADLVVGDPHVLLVVNVHF